MVGPLVGVAVVVVRLTRLPVRNRDGTSATPNSIWTGLVEALTLYGGLQHLSTRLTMLPQSGEGDIDFDWNSPKFQNVRTRMWG